MTATIALLWASAISDAIQRRTAVQATGYGGGNAERASAHAAERVVPPAATRRAEPVAVSRDHPIRIPLYSVRYALKRPQLMLLSRAPAVSRMLKPAPPAR